MHHSFLMRLRYLSILLRLSVVHCSQLRSFLVKGHLPCSASTACTAAPLLTACRLVHQSTAHQQALQVVTVCQPTKCALPAPSVNRSQLLVTSAAHHSTRSAFCARMQQHRLTWGQTQLNGADNVFHTQCRSTCLPMQHISLVVMPQQMAPGCNL